MVVNGDFSNLRLCAGLYTKLSSNNKIIKIANNYLATI